MSFFARYVNNTNSSGGGGDYWETSIPNNTYLYGRNAADDSNIALIKVNSSDAVEIGDGYANIFIASPASIGSLSFRDGDYAITMYAPIGGLADNYSLVLPADAGSNGDVLTTDGSGGLSWEPGGGGGITWATPVDSDITLDTTATYSIGTDAVRLLDVFAEGAQLASDTPAWWGAEGFGLIQDQGFADGVLLLGIKSHAPDSVAAGSDIHIYTGAKPGASSTQNTGAMWVLTGDNAGSGDTGALFFSSGENAGTGDTGSMTFASGNVTAGNGTSGDVYIQSGQTSGSGDSGLISLLTGTSDSGARGDIQLFGNRVDASSSIGPLRVPNLAADPASPLDGDIWYNTSSTELKARVNGSTVVLA